jgi:hypothetical protein
MDFIKPLETYANETYPNLVHFVISLFVFRKSLSFGARHTSWRLGQEEWGSDGFDCVLKVMEQHLGSTNNGQGECATYS